MKISRWIIKILKYIAFAAAGLILLLSVIFGLTQTGFGKRKIARVLSSVLSEGPENRVSIEGISGFIPFQTRIKRISLSDRGGCWLAIDQLSWRISTSALLEVRIQVNELEASGITLTRLPERTGETPQKPPSKGPILPKSWPDLRVESLSIRHLVVGEALLGEKVESSLNGSFLADAETGVKARLRVSRMGGTAGSVDLRAAANRDSSKIKFDLEVKEGPGGLLAGLLGLTKNGPFGFSLHGEGPADNWRLAMKSRIPDSGSLAGDFVLKISDQLDLKGELTLQNLILPGLRIDSSEVQVDVTNVLSDPAGSIEINAQGKAEKSFAGELKLVCRKNENRQSFELEKLRVTYGKNTITSMGPIRLTWDKENIDLGKTELAVNAGKIILSGELTPNSVNGSLKVDRLPLELLELCRLPGLGGTASSHLTINGTPGQPEIKLDLRLEDVELLQSSLAYIKAATLSLQAGLENNLLALSLSGEDGSGSTIQGEAKVPIKLALYPFSFRIPLDRDIRGGIKAQIDLGMLEPLFYSANQVVKGIVSFDLSLGGSLDHPSLRGQLNVEEGTYENMVSGTVFRDIAGEIEANASRVSLKNLEASTPSKGKVRLDGHIQLAPKDNFPLEFKLRLDRARLINQDLISAAASGEVTLTGTTKKLALKGDISVDRAEVAIPRRFSGEEYRVEVTEINRPGQPSPPQSPKKSSAGLPVELDLTVNSPGKIFVRGRGLDSEWGIALKASGTTGKPFLVGSLSLVQGHLSFLGKRFILGNCTISLTGGFPPMPDLNINAQITTADITAYLSLSGTINKPKLELTSNPQYPEDEILSLMLFGKHPDQITAFQAIQIAYGINLLRGGGDAFDVLGTGRSWLSVDMLSVNMEDGNVSSVGVGKYITDYIYVEGEKSLDGPGDRIRVDIDLTTFLQLQGETGIQSGDGLYLYFHQDY